MTFLDQVDRTSLAAARHFAAHEDGAVVREDAGLFMVASAYPFVRSLFYSSARRFDRGVPAEKAIAALRAFDDEHGSHLNLWLSLEGDPDLVAAAEAAGLTRGIELEDMATATPPALPEPAPGVELVRVADAATADAFGDVHRALRAEADQDPESVLHFASHAVLLDPRVHAYVAYLDGAPAACAMAFRHEETAGLFWVATKTEARNRGLGALVSAAPVRSVFQDGAESVTLTATALGAPVYRRLGFERFSTRTRYNS
ncbi:GNAT family N-acetyltransferase [Catenulispora subtropica]|uniref:N-acetyltransferase domain-containing protein n=1 Tax=Catenulispora subtropica TaxID=450798 RepID=A0ABN2SMV8_9ACTN